ncbi:FUSC family protein [Clostridium neonatale]|uniref:FUSC family protein n=1 Tax=Clostridium neonatale TaxID=137838 RepID=UPI0029372911|nr:FUSC family protein [Clostridium neonatale]
MNNFISGDISDNDKVYYNNLKDIFSFMETRINLEDNSFLIERINYFKKNYYLSDLKSEQAMNSILGLLTYALSDLRYVSINKSEEKWKLPKKVFSIQGFRNFLRIDLFQLRFALRLSLVLCISFLFCRVTKLNHGYWYPMSAFLMLMPNSEESLLKINYRILGTIAGSCITLVLGHVFHGLNQ